MYQCMNQNPKDNKQDEAYVNYRPYKGRCCNCGKIDHKAQQCRLRRNNHDNNCDSNI